jgi:phosphoribosyl-AMP cyclohydrolase
MDLIDELDFEKAGGLVAAIAVDDATGDVLMVAWMNEASFRKTLELGEAVYWSRTRQELWHKGATSGHTQKVQSLSIDCDGDVVLMRVVQEGGACHTGRRSCFYRRVSDGCWETTSDPIFDPKKVYGS